MVFVFVFKNYIFFYEYTFYVGINWQPTQAHTGNLFNLIYVLNSFKKSIGTYIELICYFFRINQYFIL